MEEVGAGGCVHTPVMKTRVDCGTRPQNFRAGLDYERGERSPKQNILYADSRLENILADESLFLKKKKKKKKNFFP